MARYTGPKTKKARSFNEPIFGFDKSFEKKKYPPGQHGLAKKRRQFRKTFENAVRKSGVTGENLLQLLEARLDNVCYRLGLSNTRSGARQLVSHGHIAVNGTVTTIPSFTVKPGDVVAVRGKSQSVVAITDSIAANSSNARKYTWLNWNNSKMEGSLLNYPTRDLIPENINEQLIVELYSK